MAKNAENILSTKNPHYSYKKNEFMDKPYVKNILNETSQNKSLKDMSLKEQFNAAVNVIRNLPKNGSYQPSNELKLKFYSFFKQATEGPNKRPKPTFYEIVEKHKWEAWKKLGDMSKYEAMINYVNELKTIVETMPYNESISEFYNSLGPFFEYVKDSKNDSTKENVSNEEESILKDKEYNSHSSNNSDNDDFSDTLDNLSISNGSNKNSDFDKISLQNDKIKNIEDSNFIDCVDINLKQRSNIICAQGYSKNIIDSENNFHNFQDCTDKTLNPNEIICARGEIGIFSSKNTLPSRQNFSYETKTSLNTFNIKTENNGLNSSSNDEDSCFNFESSDLNDIHEYLTLTVLRLQQAIKNMSNKIELLEMKLNEKQLLSSSPSKNSVWLNNSTKTTVLLILWPFAAHFLINAIKNKRK